MNERDKVQGLVIFACKQLKRQEEYIEIVNSGGLVKYILSVREGS